MSAVTFGLPWMNSAPSSQCAFDEDWRRVKMRPPTRSRASTMVGFHAGLSQFVHAANPAAPAPMISTSRTRYFFPPLRPPFRDGALLVFFPRLERSFFRHPRICSRWPMRALSRFRTDTLLLVSLLDVLRLALLFAGITRIASTWHIITPLYRILPGKRICLSFNRRELVSPWLASHRSARPPPWR